MSSTQTAVVTSNEAGVTSKEAGVTSKEAVVAERNEQTIGSQQAEILHREQKQER
jgi:hypothetical protein